MSFEQLCILLVVGALAGWLAGLILRRRGFGLAGNLIIGVIGSFLGRFVLSLLGFYAGSTLAAVITAVLGALLLLWLLSFIPGRAGKKK
ncbi:MAG: GlsB/YeaQ/YmgE family stress response membrane protein [Burkholderiales bacterium]|nr:GlsB/YeaQ/YmgE family stress response membrane protein [Opitutaceae bacterium]